SCRDLDLGKAPSLIHPISDRGFEHKKKQQNFLIPEKTTIFICACSDFDNFVWITKISTLGVNQLCLEQ
ncbi:MAG: hypothetical protein LUC43_07410, partial [Burkholderiales bacterium]|nr:hypothetical protein [Burkholderiales bacterium]